MHTLKTTKNMKISNFNENCWIFYNFLDFSEICKIHKNSKGPFSFKNSIKSYDSVFLIANECLLFIIKIESSALYIVILDDFNK